MTADATSTASLLNILTEALTSAAEAFPSDPQSLLTPTEGISLLDVKNDLLLSYLHNLVFLIILRLRNGNNNADAEDDEDADSNLDSQVIRKLIELRVYVERGVRPLEGRLRYQIDKVLRAAEEADRVAVQKQGAAGKKDTKKKQKQKKTARTNGTTENGYDSSDASNSDSDSNASSNSGDDDDQEDEDEETLYRPNVAALAQKLKTESANNSSTNPRTSSSSQSTFKQAPYKPPRITPTSMPSLPSTRSRDAENLSSDRDRQRRRKSNLLNEYIDEELSTTPRAQPSIGSNNTITSRGRGGGVSARDREKERERLEYEETNFVRLPGESKADRKKARLRGEVNQRDMFGGEDWTGLGGLGDRINRSVQQGSRRGDGGREGGMSVLERREKRRRETQDGPRGDGMAVGETFAKRQKVLEDRAERKRRRKG